MDSRTATRHFPRATSARFFVRTTDGGGQFVREIAVDARSDQEAISEAAKQLRPGEFLDYSDPFLVSTLRD